MEHFLDNVNREVFALLGDQEPQMVPAEEASGDEKEEKKKIPKLDRPVDKWVFNPFKNPARGGDELELNHWTKEKEKNDVYPFSKFNKQARIITYTDEEYKRVVATMASDWTKLETDVLFDLCQRFSLRFIVIADRFNYELAEKEAEQDCIAAPKPKLKKRE